MPALIFCDGFDKYGPPGNQNYRSVLAGEWAFFGGSTISDDIVAGLSSPGYAFRFKGGGTAGFGTPQLPALTRIVTSFRFRNDEIVSTQSGLKAIFYNGANPVFTVLSRPNTGAIELRTGLSTGTLLNSGGAIALNTTHVLAFDVTIGAAAAYAVYLDGVLLFSGTGNTGNGQSSVNIINFVATATDPMFTLDDFAIFDPTHAAYNSSVLTQSVVVETQFPISDSQTQFTNDSNVVWPAGTASNGLFTVVSSGAQSAPGANQVFLLKVTPIVNCTISSVSLIPGVGNGAAKHRAVIYSDSGGSPSALLSSGTEVVGAVSGVTLTGALTTPQALTAGTSYWIGFIGDTSVALRQVDSTTALGQRKANTYTVGAPASLSGMTTGQATWWMWGNCFGATANFGTVGMNPPLGTSAAQTRSGTVGAEDLFGFPAAVTNPATIYGVAVKGLVAKTDTGSRTVSFNTKSVAADSTGSAPSQALATSSQWQRSSFDLDPATSAAWTTSGINNAKSGVSIAS